MDTQVPSRSRRSYPNLHNLSLAPLSSAYPLDASQPPSPTEASTTPRTSYIAQKSAPTTPGILSLSHSRSNSRNRHRPSKAAAPLAYESYFAPTNGASRDISTVPKAKSTTALPGPPGVKFIDNLKIERTHHTRKHTTPTTFHLPLVRHHTPETNDEWLHRAGLAIAGETRESKGQSWLVRRTSSSSLVDNRNEYEAHASHDVKHMALLSGEHTDLDFPTYTPRMSRVGSRITSRVGSRIASRVASTHNSRRGSRVGSRIDLSMSAAPSKHQSLDIDHDIFSPDSQFPAPDFINENDAETESSGDEQEIARLASSAHTNFGLGNWMDRLISWTLFSVDEDSFSSSSSSDDDDDEHSNYDAYYNEGLDYGSGGGGGGGGGGSGGSSRRPENMTREELILKREVDAKRRKMERESIAAASAVAVRKAGLGDGGGERVLDEGEMEEEEEEEESGGWKDAAWLFGVASKALF